MFPRRKIVSGAGCFAAIIAAWTPATAQTSAASTSKREKNLTIGEAEAKRMLLLMDRDQNGMVSKTEFMSFMEAEFDRLDKNGDGQLDVKELTKTMVRVRGAIHR